MAFNGRQSFLTVLPKSSCHHIAISSFDNNNNYYREDDDEGDNSFLTRVTWRDRVKGQGGVPESSIVPNHWTRLNALVGLRRRQRKSVQLPGKLGNLDWLDDEQDAKGTPDGHRTSGKNRIRNNGHRVTCAHWREIIKLNTSIIKFLVAKYHWRSHGGPAPYPSWDRSRDLRKTAENFSGMGGDVGGEGR